VPDLPYGLQEALFDRYTLERPLGRGGMATVYLAEDLKHGRVSRSRSCIRSSPPRWAPSAFRSRWDPPPG